MSAEKKEKRSRGTHDGHRQRLKERFRRSGLEDFNDINALELLLFFGIPRGDTNELAHGLLERFGSFSGVLEAQEKDLAEFDGVGDHTALLLNLIPQICRRYLTDKFPEAEPLDSPTTAGRYFIPRFMAETEEVVLAALLDARKRVIACQELSRGTVNAAEIRTRRLAELCLKRRASGVILAHNHLSGVAAPSREDELTTAQTADALDLLGVELHDHIIVAGCEYVSMKECGLI